MKVLTLHLVFPTSNLSPHVIEQTTPQILEAHCHHLLPHTTLHPPNPYTYTHFHMSSMCIFPESCIVFPLNTLRNIILGCRTRSNPWASLSVGQKQTRIKGVIFSLSTIRQRSGPLITFTTSSRLALKNNLSNMTFLFVVCFPSGLGRRGREPSWRFSAMWPAVQGDDLGCSAAWAW